MTITDRIRDLNKEIDELTLSRDADIANLPFQVGSAVLYDGKLWRVVSVHVGRTEPIGELWLKLRGGASRFIHWSSNETSVREPDFEQIELAPEPVLDTEAIDACHEKIKEAGSELVDARFALSALALTIRRQKQELTALGDPCVHRWGAGVPTGETIKHVVGESKQVEYVCEICGTTGYEC